MKIIVISFLLAWMICYSHSEPLLLHTVDGEVGRGNYTYYSLMYDGPITLWLHSIEGDADLYVSQLVTKPTFEPEFYCLQSSTCGLDVIHIPGEFNRPVGIGVYGHSSYEFSTYELEVYTSEIEYESLEGYYSSDSEFTPADDGSGNEDFESNSEYWSQESKGRRTQPSRGEEVMKEDSFIWTLLVSIIDVLLEILFL